MRETVGPRELRSLLDAVMAIGSELDLPVVLRRITEVAVEMVSARFGALGVLDPSGTHLQEFITVGLSPDQEARIGSRPEGHGILGVLIVEPKTLRLDDLSQHPDTFGFPSNHPRMTTFLGVPILVRGEVFGNLYLCDKARGPFTEADEELITSLAAAAGIAVEKARLHAAAGHAARLEDRDRIARDLHDTVIQRLYAAGLSLQSAAARARREPEIEARIQAAIDEVDGAILDIRSAIFELTPLRDRNGLRRRVLDLVSELAPLLPSTPETRIAGPVDTSVDPTLVEEVLAVAREALTNVARHARASRIWVALEVSGPPRRLVLTVVDDGVGLQQAEGDGAGGGMGLRNLEDRAAARGGSCRVEPGSASGTVLRWAVPLS